MKKMLVAIVSIILLLLLLTYFIIPNDLQSSYTITINTSNKNVYEYLKNDSSRHAWWPETLGSNKFGKEFPYGSQNFVFKDLLYNAMILSVGEKNDRTETNIMVIPVQPDTSKIVWKSQTINTSNPFSRIANYVKSSRTKKNVINILHSLKDYLDNNQNIYGFKINTQTLQDTLFLSHTTLQDSYPSQLLIDSEIEQLRGYLQQQNIRESGFPIMMVNNIANNKYSVVFGLPISKPVPETNDFVLRTMPGNGKAISTIVTGGNSEVQKGIQAILRYQQDFLLNQPIIPFISFVTDRKINADSTQWETKIWGPIY